MRVDALNQVSQIYQQAKPKKTAKTDNAYTKDEFQISREAKDYQVAKQAVSEASEIREDKVAQYKEALASGTYNVSSQEIAEKMVSKLFDSLI
ncbi:MAG: flagellar biosynthesis anti-sigma factor FlgM [Lachnospiraceae bacterium]|nr:flagellar biosynthesis anti-sigma factor FlgM [Lachnospiraceae bacterium]